MNKVNGAVKAALETPAVRERLMRARQHAALGDARSSSAHTVKADRARWAEVVKAVGATDNGLTRFCVCSQRDEVARRLELVLVVHLERAQWRSASSTNRSRTMPSREPPAPISSPGMSPASAPWLIVEPQLNTWTRLQLRVRALQLERIAQVGKARLFREIAPPPPATHARATLDRVA